MFSGERRQARQWQRAAAWRCTSSFVFQAVSVDGACKRAWLVLWQLLHLDSLQLRLRYCCAQYEQPLAGLEGREIDSATLKGSHSFLWQPWLWPFCFTGPGGCGAGGAEAMGEDQGL